MCNKNSDAYTATAVDNEVRWTIKCSWKPSAAKKSVSPVWVKRLGYLDK